MKSGRMKWILAVLVLGTFAAPVHASDPIGVYGLVERVVFEPAETNPQRVQIWGVFAVSDGKSGDGYLPAQRGYLYYTLTAGQEDTCKREWADLKSVAGKGQGVGFGRRRQNNGRIRKAGEKADAADTYPIGMGVVKMGSQHRQPELIQELKNVRPTQ